MKKENFTEIKKKTENVGKHIGSILLGLLAITVAGYFIYIGFKI